MATRLSTDLARLAVDGRDIARVLGEPLVHVLAKRPDQLQSGRMVIVKRELSDALVEL